jgi:hypothetical protein
MMLSDTLRGYAEDDTVSAYPDAVFRIYSLQSKQSNTRVDFSYT